jgi:hypothetical protein
VSQKREFFRWKWLKNVRFSGGRGLKKGDFSGGTG